MTEVEWLRKEHRCSFSGHRPEKMNCSTGKIIRALKKEIECAIADGYTTFISGMARGVDIWAAEIVLKKKQKNKELRLVCAIPFRGVENQWDKFWKRKFRAILPQADYIKYFSDFFSDSELYMIRNRWMIDRSTRLIAVFGGEKGGTYSTILYARKKGVSVCLIPVRNRSSIVRSD